MARPTSPLRSRVVPLTCLYLGAPVTAEFLYAYLASTGDVAEMAFAVLFLAPLYGGAALLVREVAARTGRGWRGVLGLGAAFGLLMTGVVDLSMFGAHRDDVAFWELKREPTLVAPLGISVWSTLTFVAGHVLLSVLAPLGLLHALAPAQRGRPLLGRVGLVVVPVLLVGVAALVHADSRQVYDLVPSAAQLGWAALGVVAVVALALGPAGRPGPTSDAGRALPAWRPCGLGVAATAVSVAVPTTWLGVGLELPLLASLAGVVGRWSRSRRWGPRQIGLLASGLVVGQTLAGLLTPPPPGVGQVAATVSQLVLLTASLGLLGVVLRRTGREDARPVQAGARSPEKA